MTTAGGDPKAAALALLRERYRHTITKTIDAFRNLADQLRVAPAASEVLETLRRELHRVRGSAGSYGYAEASKLAEQVERRAIRWAAEPTLETEQRANIVAHFASALELAFRQGEGAPAEQQPLRTFLVVGMSDQIVSALRAESQLHGFRVAALTLEQCTAPVMQDIAPSVVAVRPEHVEVVGSIAWPRGVPVIVLEHRAPEERNDEGAAKGGLHSTVADIRDGVIPAFEVAERLLTRRSGIGSTVLAVDDDPSILAMVRYFLEGPQVRVVTLEDASQLHETIDEVQPSLLLMDIQMPGHSGIELARSVRASPRTSDLPIVLLSGETDPESRGRAHESGADEFISKPIAPAQLRARIAAQLERHRLKRLGAGLHPATGLPVPENTRQLGEELLVHEREAGRDLTIAVIKPTGETEDDAALAGWLRETSRIGNALASRSLLVGYHDESSLLLAFGGEVESAGDTLRALETARPAGAPDWRAGVVSSADLPRETWDRLVNAASEATEMAVGAASMSVHRWQRDEGLIAPDVVLVEDDAPLSEMLQYALRATGFTYRAFANGRLALDALLKLKTHGRRPFVLLDIDLPGMDGYSLHERLRVERPGEFAFVYITAHAAEPDQLRALRSGAVDFIAKPINLRILMAKMSAWSEALGRHA
jgi:DNA-binding response OmpR family regulator/HPt (histidine-containing phosphotransfer) domain-containing protein